jgi:hypothetical protein
MKVEFFTAGSTEGIVERIRNELEKRGFIFAENEKSYHVHYSKGEVEKVQTWSKFWARKQLEDPYPPFFSIEIDGEVVLEGKNAIIKADFIENHANRPHGAGGSRAIYEYVDLFCEILRDQ